MGLKKRKGESITSIRMVTLSVHECAKSLKIRIEEKKNVRANVQVLEIKNRVHA